MVLDDEHVPDAADVSASQSASTRSSHGIATTAAPIPAPREELGGGERLVQHHRPVRDEHRVAALAQGAPTPGTGR